MKAPEIKHVTKEELYAFFQYINGDAKNSGWDQEQTQIIGTVLGEQDVIPKFILKLIAQAPADFTMLDAFLSAVIFGFQFGREFEFRQMVKEMRDGNGDV